MEEKYLLTAVRYIELNPVRAALVQKPEEYCWSSAPAHLAGRDDLLVKVALLPQLVTNRGSFLSEAPDEEEVRLLRKHVFWGTFGGTLLKIIKDFHSPLFSDRCAYPLMTGNLCPGSPRFPIHAC
jgi:putative transposase